MRVPLILNLALTAMLATTPGLAERPVTDTQHSLDQVLAEADSRELFLRCCWALGRAGFHHCKEYGVCKTDPEATCQGIGAAEGMTASCKTDPPDLPDEGG